MGAATTTKEIGERLAAFLGILGGAVLGRFTDDVVSKQTVITLDPKLIQGIKLVVGGAAALAIPGKGGLVAFARGAGAGFAAESAESLLVQMGALSGATIGSVPGMQIRQRQLRGPGKSQTILPSVGTVVKPSAVGRAARGRYAGIYN